MTERLAVARCRGLLPGATILALPAPARIQTRLIGRAFLVLVCLRIFERETKTKDSQSLGPICWSGCLCLGREALTGRSHSQLRFQNVRRELTRFRG